MCLKPFDIPDVKLIAPKRNEDARGFLCETYNAQKLQAAGIEAVFVQDNEVLTHETGVLRGLHYQSPPAGQAKLIRVVRGSIFDVAVDIRKDSDTFNKHVTRKLSQENGEQLFVPEGFAHGYLTLEPETLVSYKVTAFWAPELEHGVLWNDPALGIDWPLPAGQINLNERDAKLPTLAEAIRMSIP